MEKQKKNDQTLLKTKKTPLKALKMLLTPSTSSSPHKNQQD